MISVIIPYFNGELLIDKAIESLKNQTFKKFEIIIVDDFSRNKFYLKNLIAKKYSSLNIKILRNKKNQGTAYSLNRGIKNSSFQYVSWLSHDDYYDKKKLKLDLMYLRQGHPVVYSNFYTVDKNYILKKKINTDLNFFFNDQFKNLLMRDNLHGCSISLNKNIFHRFGFFNTKLKHTQDYEFWFRIIEKVKFKKINEYLVYSLIHDNQNSILYKDNSIIEKKYLYTNLLLNFSLSKKINIFELFVIIFLLKKRNMIDLNKFLLGYHRS